MLFLAGAAQLLALGLNAAESQLGAQELAVALQAMTEERDNLEQRNAVLQRLNMMHTTLSTSAEEAQASCPVVQSRQPH